MRNIKKIKFVKNDTEADIKVFTYKYSITKKRILSRILLLD